MITPRAIKRVAVLGGSGMLGSDLVRMLGRERETTAITRENYEEQRGREFDVLLNANGNSRRFWANEHPLADFEASTASVYKSLFDFKFKKYIYISSSDVYENHGDPEFAREEQATGSDRLSPYGLHKYLAEKIVRNHARDCVILRSSMILGSALKKGPVLDVLTGQPLFITLDSRLQFITTEEIANIAIFLIEKNVTNETFNMGGRGAVYFKTAAELLGAAPLVSPDAARQEYEMNVEKLRHLYPLRTSEEYLRKFHEAFSIKA